MRADRLERGLTGLVVRPIAPADAGEVLTVQRAAFVQEAQLYDDARIAPLVQTLDELRAELADNLGVVAVRGDRIVGAARAIVSGSTLLIGRIAVAPDEQGEGAGGALLEALERRGRDAGCAEAELFTGSLSTANLELYRSAGYVESERVDQDDGTAQVFLRKHL
ncbi:GNAT family N-acetyltransferase [Microbacterium aoyamense]|uniref:GNAT family N-acetyltransferase n=1 Tax=Microbacterium aoyamense TaxID=344166 RepID=A0ABP5B159_9MICO